MPQFSQQTTIENKQGHNPPSDTQKWEEGKNMGREKGEEKRKRKLRKEKREKGKERRKKGRIV